MLTKKVANEINNKLQEKIRQNNSRNMVSLVKLKRDFSMKEAYEDIHRQRQINVGAHAFEAMGYSNND